MVQQGMALAAAGVAIGIASALMLTRFLQSLLFGVKARDLIVFFGVPVLLIRSVRRRYSLAVQN